MAQQRWELEQLSHRLDASRQSIDLAQPSIPLLTHEDTPTTPSANPATRLPSWITQRVATLSAHLNQQQTDFQAAQLQTRQVFNELLDALELMAESFRAEMAQHAQPTDRIYATIDPDRSIGILTLLWHSVSFSVCDQYQPLAVERRGHAPLLACRIMATLGDYRHQHSLWETPETTQGPHEFASLFVPAPAAPVGQAHLPNALPTLPSDTCLLRFTHTPGDRYLAWDQVVPVFLSSVLDALCGGGMLHNQ